jgi:hypothetical protein
VRIATHLANPCSFEFFLAFADNPDHNSCNSRGIFILDLTAKADRL